MIFQICKNNGILEIMDFQYSNNITLWNIHTCMHAHIYIHTQIDMYVYMYNNNAAFFRLHSNLMANNSTYMVNQKVKFTDQFI